MFFSSAKHSLVVTIGLSLLVSANPATAIETKRSCSIGLNNDQYVVLSGYQGTVMDVLANDSGDLDQDSLVTVGQSTAAGGTVYVVAGTITYSPPPNFSGEDSFSYQVSEKDWRSNNEDVTISANDAGAPPSVSATGTPLIAAPSLGSSSDWQAGLGIANESVFGRLLKVDANYTGCYQDSDPRFNLRLQWLLTKRSGATNPSNEFEASISPLGNHPQAALASQSYAWPSSTSRQLNLALDDLAGSQLESFRAGLFAQARDAFGSYRWRSGGVQVSAKINTSHCELCTREARVTITVDTDSDGDGISDSRDADDDNDGIADVIEGRADADSDGVPNHQDLDSDNDGIYDLVEAGGTNTLGNGRLNDTNDANADGLNDLAQSSVHPERDSDGDGVLDFLDLDSDNDGIPDLMEQGQPDRAPHDGRVDGFRDANGDGAHDQIIAAWQTFDTDGDNKLNSFDLDADGDQAFDTVENGLTDIDRDRNGVLDPLEDSNENGIIDAVDASVTQGPDTNQNGIDDAYDAFSQSSIDRDNDGISDDQDPDANGDGWLDAATPRMPTDADNNGTADYLQANYQNSLVDDLGGSNGQTATAGLEGYGGCTTNPSARFDPQLVLLVLLSAIYLARRKSAKHVKGS